MSPGEWGRLDRLWRRFNACLLHSTAGNATTNTTSGFDDCPCRNLQGYHYRDRRSSRPQRSGKRCGHGVSTINGLSFRPRVAIGFWCKFDRDIKLIQKTSLTRRTIPLSHACSLYSHASPRKGLGVAVVVLDKVVDSGDQFFDARWPGSEGPSFIPRSLFHIRLRYSRFRKPMVVRSS